jgi:hypothetical protein
MRADEARETKKPKEEEKFSTNRQFWRRSARKGEAGGRSDGGEREKGAPVLFVSAEWPPSKLMADSGDTDDGRPRDEPSRTATTVEKRGRGRPKYTDEQKAEAYAKKKQRQCDARAAASQLDRQQHIADSLCVQRHSVLGVHRRSDHLVERALVVRNAPRGVPNPGRPEGRLFRVWRRRLPLLQLRFKVRAASRLCPRPPPPDLILTAPTPFALVTQEPPPWAQAWRASPPSPLPPLPPPGSPPPPSPPPSSSPVGTAAQARRGALGRGR